MDEIYSRIGRFFLGRRASMWEATDPTHVNFEQPTRRERKMQD